METSNKSQVATRLDWRIASEEPDFDLDTDLWTCTASDGATIYAPTADECNRERTRHEYMLRFRAFARTRPGTREHTRALDALMAWRNVPGVDGAHGDGLQDEAACRAVENAGQSLGSPGSVRRARRGSVIMRLSFVSTSFSESERYTALL